jgi:hypothetical protein
MLCARIRLRPRHVATFWVPDLFGVRSSTWQWIAFPRDRTGALFSRRHSFEDPGELGHLPCRGAQLRGLRLPDTRGCGPAATPVLSTDVCCSRILFSKTIASSLGARRIAMFPRDTRARGFTPQRPLRRTDRSRRGVVYPSRRFGRRTSDAPSLAGSPGGALSTGVGPRSCDLRSKPESLGPLHQAA